MGLLSKAIGLVTRYAPMLPGVGGVAGKAIGVISRVGGVMGKAPGVAKVGAKLAAGGAAFELGSRAVRGGGYRIKGPRPGEAGYRRKSHRGLTGRDIQGAQRVAKLVQAFGFRPKVKPRKKGRH